METKNWVLFWKSRKKDQNFEVYEAKRSWKQVRGRLQLRGRQRRQCKDEHMAKTLVAGTTYRGLWINLDCWMDIVRLMVMWGLEDSRQRVMRVFQLALANDGPGYYYLVPLFSGPNSFFINKGHELENTVLFSLMILTLKWWTNAWLRLRVSFFCSFSMKLDVLLSIYDSMLVSFAFS